MAFRTQAELDEALRTGTVEDPTVLASAESVPADSTPPDGAAALSAVVVSARSVLGKLFGRGKPEGVPPQA